MTVQMDPATGLPIETTPPTPPGVVIQVAPPAAPNGASATLSNEQVMELIEKARTEEKNKLYPQMEEMRTNLTNLTKERDDRIAAEQAEAARVAEAARLASEAEMTAIERLEQFKTEQDQRFAEIIAERDRSSALLEREREFSRLNEYKVRRMAENADDIIPQFADYVRGNTEQEIEASILTAKEKSAQIVQEMQEAQDRLLQGGVRRPAPLPISGTPPVDLMGNVSDQFQRLTAEDINAMTPDEYSQHRQELLRAASDSVRTRGIYAP